MRPSKTRRRIAWEAARLIHESPELLRSDALRLAAERLCPAGVKPRDVPSVEEVGDQLAQFAQAGEQVPWHLRFDYYEELLRPLSRVQQDPEYHPEGDVLYHSLQVFVCAQRRLDYDEEFLTAALLHDVGLAIDRSDPIQATLLALQGVVTGRTLWLVEHLPLALTKLEGTIGSRARKRLEEHADCETLYLLAECDLAGRERRAPVPELEEALDALRELSLEEEIDFPEFEI